MLKFLADIPFVRLRNALPDTHPLKMDTYQFSDVVEQINQSNQNLSLEIDVTHQYIRVNGGEQIDIPAREMAMLMWFADNKIKGQAGIKAPTGKAKGDNSDAEIQIIEELTAEYLTHYDELKGGETSIVVNKEFFESTKSKLKTSRKKLGVELAARIVPKQNGRSMPFIFRLKERTLL